MKKLGGEVVGFAEPSQMSVNKGESLFDTMKVIGQYVDVIVLRHPFEGAARLAADAANKPVINAGDGANQHPTQALLDLFSIQECQGQLQNLHIAFVGDLKHGRTIHSLVHACAHFNMRMYFVANPELDLPQQICDNLKSSGILFSFHASLNAILPKLDVIYMTRVQQERLGNYAGHNQRVSSYTLTPKTLENVKPSLRILHPLPRIKEIDPALDSSPYAYYFQQSQNGLFVRQALLSLILGKQGTAYGKCASLS